MRVKINKFSIDGVKYYKGYKKYFWIWFPVTGLYRYKEEVKEKLNIY